MCSALYQIGMPHFLYMKHTIGGDVTGIAGWSHISDIIPRPFCVRESRVVRSKWNFKMSLCDLNSTWTARNVCVFNPLILINTIDREHY